MKNLQQFVERGNAAQGAVNRIIADVEAVDAWNQQHDVGTLVNVRLDDGSIKETETQSLAWMLGGHTACVMLKGISGGYALSRVTFRKV